MDNKTPHTLMIAALLLLITACTNDRPDSATACSIHPNSPASTVRGADNGDQSLRLSWEEPAFREDGTDLLSEEIEGYLIVAVPGNDEHKFYDQMSIIDPENYKEGVPAGSGLYLPAGSIPALALSNSPYAIVVSCSGKTELLIENTEPNTYYFTISTIATDGDVGDIDKYSVASETVSISLL
jgi:hypothetical protein